ncbi:hypothetical protein ACQ65B_003850, partial [Escherichia coli]
QGPACKYLPISIDTENKWSFNCSACADPHSPHHKIHFKKGRQGSHGVELMPPKTTHSNVVIYNRMRTPTI